MPLTNWKLIRKHPPPINELILVGSYVYRDIYITEAKLQPLLNKPHKTQGRKHYWVDAMGHKLPNQGVTHWKHIK